VEISGKRAKHGSDQCYARRPPRPLELPEYPRGAGQGGIIKRATDGRTAAVAVKGGMPTLTGTAEDLPSYRARWATVLCTR